MPVKSQPRLTARPLSRPSQPPPPPPPIKAPKPEVDSKGSITAVRDGSADVADTVKVSSMLIEDKSSRPPTSKKQNFPQLNQNSSTKLKGSGSPLRKPAPPVPSKPPHLQRNCLTPPPKPGNLSSVLGLSSYSLPEYELSDLEHPQLSSTLMSQVLPRTHFLSKAQTEAAKPEPEPKPPKLPVRRESMKQINDMVLRESKRSSMTEVSRITSLEESFITRFRPVSDFPASEVFTSCEKTYPSREQGSVAMSESEQLVARASLVSEDEDGGGPVSDHPPPPLPSTGPPTRSIRNINEHITPMTIARTPAPPTVPPPPPLPVENNNIPAVKPSGLIIPPPPPLPSPVTCPVTFGVVSTPVVQARTPINQSKKELMTCRCEVVDDSPISVTSIVNSGFADNLAKLYGSVKRTENCCPDEPLPLADKPRPYPVINKKPALVKSCKMKMAPPPQRPSSLRMRQPHAPINTSSSSASPTPAISSPVSTSKTKTSPVPKPPRPAPPPPPPAPFRTSSLSTTPPAVLCDSSAQTLSRSLSVRSAPPPPVPAHSSDLDRSDTHSLRTFSTSSPPLTNISEHRVAAAAHPESRTRKFSFRAAPPPPQSLNPTESPVRESSSHVSNSLGGPVLQSPKLLIC